MLPCIIVTATRNGACQEPAVLQIEFLDSDAGMAPLHRGLGDLIGAIGSPTFEGSMLDFAAQEIHCTHLTAFARCLQRPPRILMAIDRRDAHVARRIAT